MTKLDRSLMEEFGKLIVQNNCLDMVASLHDQYLDFVCLERNLFSLSNKADSYALMNGSGVTDNVMEKYLEEIAYGLLSVVGTTGSVPVVRCPRVSQSVVKKSRGGSMIYRPAAVFVFDTSSPCALSSPHFLT